MSASSDKKEATCEVCGRSFQPYPQSTGRYCSQKCWHQSQCRRVIAACEQCGREFTAKLSDTRGRFCNQQCWGAWQSLHWVGDAHPKKGKKCARASHWPPPTVKECAVCEGKFIVKPSDLATRLTCSKRCAGMLTVIKMNATRAAKRPERAPIHCAICGQEVHPWPGRVRAQNFCSRTCWGTYISQTRSGSDHPLWKGGHVPYYGPSWLRASREARKRDGKCQHCGRTREDNGRALSVHHLKPFRSFGVDCHLEANALDNLITLCNSCHMRVEHEEPPHDKADTPIR